MLIFLFALLLWESPHNWLWGSANEFNHIMHVVCNSIYIQSYNSGLEVNANGQTSQTALTGFKPRVVDGLYYGLTHSRPDATYSHTFSGSVGKSIWLVRIPRFKSWLDVNITLQIKLSSYCLILHVWCIGVKSFMWEGLMWAGLMWDELMGMGSWEGFMWA